MRPLDGLGMVFSELLSKAVREDALNKEEYDNFVNMWNSEIDNAQKTWDFSSKKCQNQGGRITR